MDIATLKAKGIVRAHSARTPICARFPFGLAQAGVHELAEACFGDMPALTGFTLAAYAEGGGANRAGAILWVTQARLGLEHGCVPDSALRAFSAHHTHRLVVQPAKLSDALWTIEEAIASTDCRRSVRGGFYGDTPPRARLGPPRRTRHPPDALWQGRGHGSSGALAYHFQTFRAQPL